MNIICDEILEFAVFNEIVEWISESGELMLISGCTDTVLKQEDLKQWFDSSYSYVLIQDEDKIIGIATLSSAEVGLPENVLEICHLIIHPMYRRHYNGSKIVIELMSKAKKDGIVKLVGRVCKHNEIAYKFLSGLRWRVSETNYNDDNSVFWMEKIIYNGK